MIYIKTDANENQTDNFYYNLRRLKNYEFFIYIIRYVNGDQILGQILNWKNNLP